MPAPTASQTAAKSFIAAKKAAADAKATLVAADAAASASPGPDANAAYIAASDALTLASASVDAARTAYIDALADAE